MSKPYTPGIQAGRRTHRMRIRGTDVLEQVVPLGWKPGIRLLPAGPGKSRTKTTPACRFLQMANGTRSLDGHWTAAAPQLTIRR